MIRLAFKSLAKRSSLDSMVFYTRKTTWRSVFFFGFMRSDHHTYKKSYVFPHRRLHFYANLCCRVTPAGARLHDFLCFPTPAGRCGLLRPPSGSDFAQKVLGIYVYSTKAAATGVPPAGARLHDLLCFSTPAGGVRTFTPTLGVGLCAESPRNLRILCEGSRHGGVTSGSELRITFKFSLVTISLGFRVLGFRV